MEAVIDPILYENFVVGAMQMIIPVSSQCWHTLMHLLKIWISSAIIIKKSNEHLSEVLYMGWQILSPLFSFFQMQMESPILHFLENIQDCLKEIK